MTTSRNQAPEIDDDMFAKEIIDDPYTYYGRIRELDPVHWNQLHQVWIVTRYDDATWVTLHPDIYSSSVPQLDPLPPYPPIDESDQAEYEYVQAAQSQRIITTDRPDHRNMRALLQKRFTPAVLEHWRPTIRRAVDALVDAAIPSGRMDVMADLAVPLPLLVISEMLGIPEADRQYVRGVAEHLLIGPRLSQSRMREIADAMREMDGYLEPLVEQRISAPTDDLISAVADGEVKGIFSRDQVLKNLVFLIVAGHETSINLTANGLLAFMRNPEQWRLLRSNIDELAGPATEECLRYDPPVKSIERIATQDTVLRGRNIRRLERVRWFIASANRDPDKFENPDTFNILRPRQPHLSFGNGIHLCLGAPLARIEAQETFKSLAERFSSFYLDQDELVYAPAAHLRSLKALHMRWDLA